MSEISINAGQANLVSRTLHPAVGSVIGVLGALLILVALVVDYFGGRPGVGTSEQLILSVGALLVLVATVLRYREAGGLVGALRFGAVVVQLALGLYVVRLYQIEAPAFHQFVFPTVLCGFIGFHFLPRTLRAPAFLALSVFVMFGVLGLWGGLILLSIGITLIGICHLPIAWGLRIALILAIGAALATIRAGWAQVGPVEAVLPILGSIFMFRLAIYIYDLRNDSGPKDWGSRLSYFFMLPNFIFPFFPVVDFTQWGRAQKHDDSIEIYQRGALWMLFGILHLLLYRIVNYYLAVDEMAVHDFGSLMYYVITNYALYLKVSGLFHMILGCLYMFGFALPKTHGRYYFSSSFIELWRRVNIYWKDFMQKMVFNPAYMALKKRGFEHQQAVVTSIALVFFVTWVTHAYQWFWLVGSWLLTVPDTLFWAALGGLLIVQTLANERPARPGARALIGPQTLLVIQTVSMMTTLTILWSMWSADSMGAWFGTLERGGLQILAPTASWTLPGLLQSLAILGFFAVIVTFSLGYTLGLAPKGSHPKPSALTPKSTFKFEQSALKVAITLAIIALLQTPRVIDTLPHSVQLTLLDLRISRLSDRERDELERGYYENLTGVGAQDVASGASAVRPRNWEQIRDMDAVVMTGDYLEYELLPNKTTIYKGGLFSTNDHGMRDQNYALEKPEGALRIALVGASRGMGAGVNDDETFEALAEIALTERLGRPVEILNFSVADYQPTRRLMTLERKVAQWSPDIVLYVGHALDLGVRHLATQYRNDVARPYPWLDAALDQVRATPDMSHEELRQLLLPLGPDILTETIDRFSTETQKMGAKPVWMYLPSAKAFTAADPEVEPLQDMAEASGFHTIDLSDLYKGQPIEQIWLAPWDRHPNAIGHRLIAERLVDELLSSDTTEALGLTPLGESGSE